MKGLYSISSGRSLAVAVKTLKEEDIPNQKVSKFLLSSYYVSLNI